MGQFVEGVKSLFTGPKTGNLDAEIAGRQNEQRNLLNKQLETEQNRAGELDAAAGAARRLPRGRRLLLAATGEQGLNRTLG